MKKFLIGGVSLFAILSANNAMAAGYTCEELIEYTSCNPGYYLVTGVPCPDGYTYRTGVCIDGEENLHFGASQSECEGYGGIFHGDICVNSYYKEGTLMIGVEDWSSQPTASATKNCSECPAGASCAGGTADKKLCAAGTYQPNTKQTSCIDAPLGYYVSTSGATEYTQCPIMDVKDKNGNTVNATTASAGASSMSQCIVPAGVEFKDDKGVYHFKSTCSFDFFIASTDGSCPSGYAYIMQESLLSEGTSMGMCDDPLGREGCYRLPKDARDTETCEYVFNDDYCTGTVYCDGWNTEVSVQF